MKKPMRMTIWIVSIFVLTGIIIFAGLLSFSMPFLVETSANSRLELKEHISQKMLDTMASKCKDEMLNGAEISIAFVRNDTTYYYGFERRNDTLILKENATTLFQIGSVSKVFTSSTLAVLLHENRVKLDDDIDKLLKYPLHKNLKINLVSLSNHSSGLPRMEGNAVTSRLKGIKEQPYLHYTDGWMENYLKQEIAIDQTKMGKCNYSNLGVSILGYTLAKSQGMSYAELVKQTIFDRYHMYNSFIYTEKDESRVAPAALNNSKKPLWVLGESSPAGGIVSNVLDMSRFVRAQWNSNDSAIQMTHMPTILRDSTRSVGLGWFIMKTKEGHTRLFHNGSTLYHTSSVLIDMNEQKGVVILSNTALSFQKQYLDELSASLLDLWCQEK